MQFNLLPKLVMYLYNSKNYHIKTLKPLNLNKNLPQELSPFQKLVPEIFLILMLFQDIWLEFLLKLNYMVTPILKQPRSILIQIQLIQNYNLLLLLQLLLFMVGYNLIKLDMNKLNQIYINYLKFQMKLYYQKPTLQELNQLQLMLLCLQPQFLFSNLFQMKKLEINILILLDGLITLLLNPFLQNILVKHFQLKTNGLLTDNNNFLEYKSNKPYNNLLNKTKKKLLPKNNKKKKLLLKKKLPLKKKLNLKKLNPFQVLIYLIIKHKQLMLPIELKVYNSYLIIQIEKTSLYIIWNMKNTKVKELNYSQLQIQKTLIYKDQIILEKMLMLFMVFMEKKEIMIYSVFGYGKVKVILKKLKIYLTMNITNLENLIQATKLIENQLWTLGPAQKKEKVLQMVKLLEILLNSNDFIQKKKQSSIQLQYLNLKKINIIFQIFYQQYSNFQYKFNFLLIYYNFLNHYMLQLNCYFNLHSLKQKKINPYFSNYHGTPLLYQQYLSLQNQLIIQFLKEMLIQDQEQSLLQINKN